MCRQSYRSLLDFVKIQSHQIKRPDVNIKKVLQTVQNEWLEKNINNFKKILSGIAVENVCPYFKITYALLVALILLF